MAVKKRVDFFTSEEGIRVKQSLQAMVNDSSYNTESTYSTNGELYSNNLIPFVEKHMNYLNQHPAVDPHNYVSNLRLMTRKR